MKRLVLLAMAAFGVLSGCTTVISEQSRKLVDPDIQFAKLRENPDAYGGKNVMVGGRIVAARNTKEGALVEVVQLNLSPNQMPEDSFQSGGRFLATSVDYLDSTIFKRGRLITLVGEVKGKRTLPLDEIQYTYPVIALREYYLWKDPDYDKDYFYPPLPYYDPNYFGPGAELRPYEPVMRRW